MQTHKTRFGAIDTGRKVIVQQRQQMAYDEHA